MNPTRTGPAVRQLGKSAIGNLLVLAIIAYGIWVGFQYIPQRIEAATVGSIVDQVVQRHHSTPITNDRELQTVIDRQLGVNDMIDMKDHFRTSWDHGRGTLTVAYERDLNLIFTTKTIEYREQAVLD